jgi:hypothetical protein
MAHEQKTGAPPAPQTGTNEDPLKKGTIIALTVVFTLLYIAGIVGYPWTPNDMVVKLLQPIVYVIVGYFFGRLPADVDVKKAEKAQADKDKAQAEKAEAGNRQARAEEKLKNVRAVLTPTRESAESLTGGVPAAPDATRHSVAAALRILDAE